MHPPISTMRLVNSSQIPLITCRPPAVSYTHLDVYKRQPSYLSRLFKNELDKNFIGYLTDIRMTHAIRLIHQGTDNVKELSARVGYLYPSYFCKQFKKYTGHTVSDFKRLT